MTDDWKATSPDEPEPLVAAKDVAAALRRAVAASREDEGESVARIAERAGVSPRTINRRVLIRDAAALPLQLADALLVACGGHISECELIW